MRGRLIGRQRTMSELGAVGVGLTVVFAGFMVVVGVEVYLIWKSRKRRTGGAADMVVAMEGGRVEQRAAVAEKGGGRGICMEEAVLEWLCGGGRGKRLVAQHRGVEVIPVAAAEIGVAVCGGEIEGSEEEDIFKLGGLLGPPRLLFTITEETVEEMDLEEARFRSSSAKASRPTSRASNDFVFVPSATTSPNVSPPSSPPSATAITSPPLATPYPALAPPPPKSPYPSTDDSPLCSSSAGTFTPPSAASSLSSRRPSSLFEVTSSTTTPSASASTPATFSPPACPPVTPSPKRFRRPPSLLFDPPPPPSPSSTLPRHRVHPFQPVPSPPSFRSYHSDSTSHYQLMKLDSLSPTSPIRSVPHLPGVNIEGNAILVSSPTIRKKEPPPSFSKFLPPKSTVLIYYSPAAEPSPRFSSPTSPLLSSALSSPSRVSI